MSDCIYDTSPGWTLFLDRDGVINVRLVDDYVKTPVEFEFIAGVPEAVAICSKFFSRIIIVTNQRGIARSLMSEDDLVLVHEKMTQEIIAKGGRIDAIYHCPHDRDTGCECRKPKPGMFNNALRDFPDIDPAKSIMIGDSSGDINFARNAGIKVVGVGPSASDLGADSFFDTFPEWVNCCLYYNGN